MSSRPKWRVGTRLTLIERDGPHCRYCGALPTDFGRLPCSWPQKEAAFVDGFQIDHVVPYSKGGTKDLDNLVLACDDCNRKKWNGPAPVMRPRFRFVLGPA